jgi:hypothetical protein
MISTQTLIVNTQSGKREFLISPVMLQSKELPKKFDKIVKLYFYENWFDEAYKTNLEKERLDDKFKTEDYFINYGQDFSKFYVGYLTADFENKTFWGWQGEPNKLSNADAEILINSLSNPRTENRSIVIFTPTRPSDFNLGHLKYLF